LYGPHESGQKGIAACAEAGFAGNEDVRGVRANHHVAQEMGAGLGEREVLQ
jgi:hypothetical protein